MTVIAGTALVTGATGGLGHAIARAIAGRGAQLVLSGRRAAALEPLERELGARSVIADLSERADVERLAREASDVEILVCNAGLPGSGVLDEYSAEQIDRALDVNLRAPIMLAHLLAPAMAARGHGQIVFISSLAGKAAQPASSLYSATKFGLRGFSLGLREDLHPHGVGVSVVLPGFIRGAGMFADAGAKLPPGIGTRTPEDVGSAVVAAIERDRAEVEVAPLALRAGATFAQLAPGLAAAASRRFGSRSVADDLASGQRDKR